MVMYKQSASQPSAHTLSIQLLAEAQDPKLCSLLLCATATYA
jgi:hypothetical protein